MTTMEIKNIKLYMLVDASGSMQPRAHKVIEGYNTFLKNQKDLAVEGEECSMSTFFFSTSMTTIHEDLPLGDIPPLTLEDYRPYGCTALRDATASVYLKALAAAAASRVIIVIITDGAENSSVEVSVEELKALRDKVQAIAEIVYLGSNQDAFEAGDTVGASREATLSYDDDCFLEAMDSMGSAVARARSDGTSIGFEESEREVSSGRSSSF